MMGLDTAGRRVSATPFEGTRKLARLIKCASALLAIMLAAALSHAAIDFVGDFVLPHDAYDGLDHASRSLVAVLSVTLLLGLFAGAMWAAILEGSNQFGRERLMLDRAFAGASPRFFGAVILGTFATLFAMEALDTLLQSGRVDDISDLLGGSAALGITLTLPISLAIAFAMHRLARALIRSSRTLVAITGSFLLPPRRSAFADFARTGRRAVHVAVRASLLARNAGRRAPPLTVSMSLAA